MGFTESSLGTLLGDGNLQNVLSSLRRRSFSLQTGIHKVHILVSFDITF